VGGDQVRSGQRQPEHLQGGTVHRPVMEALELVKRYKAEHSPSTLYYARGEHVPVDGVIPRDLVDPLYKRDTRGRQRVQRTVCECGVFQTLRDKLRCKEIWVVGAGKWRNPDEDLAADFEERRAENYAKLRKPLERNLRRLKAAIRGRWAGQKHRWR
jgi:hypothetical protein